MYITLTVFFVYLMMLITLAVWSRQESQSLKGYFLAGKKLPFWVVAFSTNATGESGWLLLGLTGMGFTVGAQTGRVHGVNGPDLHIDLARRLGDRGSARERVLKSV